MKKLLLALLLISCTSHALVYYPHIKELRVACARIPEIEENMSELGYKEREAMKHMADDAYDWLRSIRKQYANKEICTSQSDLLHVAEVVVLIVDIYNFVTNYPG